MNLSVFTTLFYFIFSFSSNPCKGSLPYEGSKVLNPDETQPPELENIDDYKYADPKLLRNAVSEDVFQWTKANDGFVNVPYYVDISNAFTRNSVRRIMDQAASDLRTFTCVRLQEMFFRPSADYVAVIDGGYGQCWSYVGRVGSSQELSLGRGCVYKGIAEHEVMHALGFLHEQSRPDRDEYVSINWNNIESYVQGNFEKADEANFTTQGLAYDFGSLMHYSAYSFAIDRSIPVIRPVDGDTAKLSAMGQRKGYSTLDAEKINTLYDCTNFQSEAWTPALYFDKIFLQWNLLATKTKHKDSLRYQAEEILLKTVERNKLKSALRKALMADKNLKSRKITFTYTFLAKGGNDFKDAMGLDDKRLPFDLDMISAAVETLKNAFEEGNSSLYNALVDEIPSPDITSQLETIIEVLDNAANVTTTAELAPKTMSEQSPRSCSTNDLPQTSVAYYNKLFGYTNTLYARSRGRGSVIQSSASTAFQSATTRNKLKSDLMKAINQITTMRAARFCFTYTTRSTATNNLEALKSTSVAKSESTLSDAVGLLYSAVEQGLTDIKQAYFDNGKNTTDIMADLDAALADTVVWVTTLADNVATVTGLNVTSSATEVVT